MGAGPRKSTPIGACDSIAGAVPLQVRQWHGPAAISAPKHHQTDASASALYLTMEESFRAQTWTVAGISVEASMADNPAISLSCNES